MQIDVAGTELGQAARSASPLDTNMDGHISPADALMVINTMIRRSSGSNGELEFYPDVNGDMLVTPIDALLVINYLNQHAVPTESEGESAVEPAVNAIFPTPEIISLGSHQKSQSTAASAQLTSAPVVAPWTGPAELACRIEPAKPTLVPRRPASDTEALLVSILDEVAQEFADAWDT